MKKIILTSVLVGMTFFSYAQGIGIGAINLDHWSGPLNPTSNIGRTGNVGIGTFTPTNGKLVVQQTSDFNTSGIAIQSANNSGRASLYIGGLSAFGVPASPTDATFFISATSGTRNITLNAFAGNVGIGTRRPTERLTVNGTIRAEEILVENNILPDYVFEKYYMGSSALNPEYEMPTLEEVAQFTRENNHLPGVPSAKEIQDEGLHLKKMTNTLLQKIEELTLYTIEQEERIKALEKALEKNN